MQKKASQATKRPWPLSLKMMVATVVYLLLHLVPILGVILFMMGSFMLIPLMIAASFAAVIYDFASRRISIWWLILPVILFVGHGIAYYKAGTAIRMIRSEALSKLKPFSGWDGRSMRLGAHTSSAAASRLLMDVGTERVYFSDHDGDTMAVLMKAADCSSLRARALPEDVVRISMPHQPGLSDDCVVSLKAPADPAAVLIETDMNSRGAILHGLRARISDAMVTVPGIGSRSLTYGSVDGRSLVPLMPSMSKDYFPWPRSHGAGMLFESELDEPGIRAALAVLGLHRLEVPSRNSRIPSVSYGRSRSYVPMSEVEPFITRSLVAAAASSVADRAEAGRRIAERFTSPCPKGSLYFDPLIDGNRDLLIPLLPRIAGTLRDRSRYSIPSGSSSDCMGSFLESISKLDPAILRTVAPDLREAISSGPALQSVSEPSPAIRRIIDAVGSPDAITIAKRAAQVTAGAEFNAERKMLDAYQRDPSSDKIMPRLTIHDAMRMRNAPPRSYWEDEGYRRAVASGIPATPLPPTR